MPDPAVIYIKQPTYMPGTHVTIPMRHGEPGWATGVVHQAVAHITINVHKDGMSDTRPYWLYTIILDSGDLEIFSEQQLRAEMKEM